MHVVCAGRARIALLLGAVVLASWSQIAPRARASSAAIEQERAQAVRVLLVGNSYTRFNVMPRMLAKLAASVPAPVRFDVDVEAHGGRTLRRHYRAGRALELIRTGGYTHVVLQDHSLRSVDRPEEFREYLGLFKQAIDAVSARTVLYGTWPRHPSARLYRQHPFLRSFEQMAAYVDGAYRRAAFELSAQLAPVGLAFERAFTEHPELALYRPDATHPTVAGSFLAAAVLYGTLSGQEPSEASYAPWELGREPAALLKRIAARTLEESRRQPVAAEIQPVAAEIGEARSQNKPP